MRSDKKKARALAKAAEVFGLDLSELTQTAGVESNEVIYNRAEATLDYVTTGGRRYRTRDCRCCGREFATDVSWVSCCSMQCVKEELAKTGIPFNPHKSERERWGHYIPAIVPPAALVAANKAIESKSQPDPELLSDFSIEAILSPLSEETSSL